MTNNIVAYEMITEILNQRTSFNPKSKGSRKNSFGRITNGYLYRNNEGEGGWMVVNPLQTRAKQDDTPIFAIYQDGSKVKISSHHFFSMLCDETWISVKSSRLNIATSEGCYLTDSEDVSDEIWGEEREDRPTAIAWVIPATTQEKFSASLQRGSLVTLKSGKSVREFSFKGTTKFIYEEVNLRPARVKQWPIPVITDEEYDKINPIDNPKFSAQASKASISAPITRDELDKFNEDCEQVEVPAEASTLEEVNALFSTPSEPELIW